MDPITLRFIERLLAVMIGGLAIYLGYRLFVKIPEQRDSQGKVSLPWNVTVAVSRVGPGVFFAIFGAAVVAYALHEAVTFTREASIHSTDQHQGTQIRTAREVFGGMNPTAMHANSATLPAKRVQARLTIEFINNLPGLLKGDLTAEQRRRADAEIASLKLRIMELLWGPDWGTFDAFKTWAEDGAQNPVPKGMEAAAAYYRAGDAREK